MKSFFDAYTVGTCYYPEQWDKSLWEEDLRRMKENGITVIRIGEFAWNKIEIEEGCYDYSFFDEFLELCNKYSMKVIMGTPTATPPAWASKKYPEILNANEMGLLYRHGGRRHYNYNSSKYRELSSGIVEKMAEHYGKNPAIIGWQIDNEINCEINVFYSEADEILFRKFLKWKYEDLDALNEAWGTSFWNQTYTDWDEVILPKMSIACKNPHQMLDYYRFISASARSFTKLQSDILHKYKKENDFITTNGMFGNLDNHKMREESLDIYMYDSYPSFAFGLDKADWIPKNLGDRHWSQNLTEVRSICPHFGIMEQQSGANGNVSSMEGPAPRPGQVYLWAMQSIAHGADYVSFFRWRTACFGSEIYWHGILDYDNRDNRKLKEVKAFSESLSKMNEIVGAEYAASFCYLDDYDNQWDAQTDVWHKRVSELSKESVFLFSQKKHIPYNILYFENTLTYKHLSKYPVVIYPHPVIMTDERLNVLKEYVLNGGILIIGARSGYKEINGKCIIEPGPGMLSEITGSDVKESTFVHEVDKGMTASFYKDSLSMPLFNDILTIKAGATAARVLAEYSSGYYKGEAALIENHFGKGKVLHLGSCFDEDNLEKIMNYLNISSPVKDLADIPESVEVCVRKKAGFTYVFLLNYQFEPVNIVFYKKVRDILTGEILENTKALKPFEVLVIKME